MSIKIMDGTSTMHGLRITDRKSMVDPYTMLNSMFQLDLVEKQIAFLNELHNTHEEANMNMAIATYKQLIRRKEREDENE